MARKYCSKLFLYFIDMTEQEDWKVATPFYFSSQEKKQVWTWIFLKNKLMQQFKIFLDSYLIWFFFNLYFLPFVYNAMLNRLINNSWTLNIPREFTQSKKSAKIGLGYWTRQKASESVDPKCGVVGLQLSNCTGCSRCLGRTWQCTCSGDS